MPVPHDEPSRLADALDAFLQRDRAADESDAAYLARHAEVRDLLEPMLAGAARPADHERYIGPYRLRRELGRGGMGVVYEAEHAALHRTVALKVLPSLLAIAPRRVERFLREATAVARLDHPGIVRVFDAGEADGVFYYAMELVDGRSLRAALEAVRSRCQDEPRRLPDLPQLGVATAGNRCDEIAALGVEIADALAHAHGQGVVHRDVKPQNILLGGAGDARLVDFGLVKELDESAPSVDFAGTPHYASPEQIEPARHVLDGRSDVFSLGVVLYELATLRRPFEGTSTESVLRAVLGDEPRPLRGFDPRVGRDFEAVVLQALEKVPGKRYPSAAALADDLRRCLRREPVRARHHSWWRHGGRWLARHRLLAVTAALAAALVVGGPSIAWWFSAHASAAIGRERDAAAARFDAAHRSIQQLARRLAAPDLPDAPLLQRFRLGLLHDVRQGYDELLQLAGARADGALLLEAARACTQEGRALVDLGHAGDAETVFARGVACAERARRLAPGDAPVAIALAEALTERGLTRFANHSNGCERPDFGAARQLWCELEAQPLAEAAAAQVRDGSVRTDLRFADVMRYSQPDAALEALERAQATSVWNAPTEAEADLASELCLVVAEVRAAAGDLAGAHDALNRCAPMLQRALAQSPRSFRTRALLARQHLVEAIAAASTAAAEAAARAAIAAHEVLCREYPDVIEQRRRLLVARDYLAGCLLRAGRAAQAAELATTNLELAAELAAEVPDRENLLRLALCAMTEAVVGSRTDAGVELVDAGLAEASRMLEYLTSVAPLDLRFHSFLGAAASNQAQVLLMRRQDPARAAALLERAVAAQRVAVANSPRSRTYRTFLESHLQLLIEARFRSGDVAGAEQTLLSLHETMSQADPRQLTLAAGLLRCAERGRTGAKAMALTTLRRYAASGDTRALADDRRFAALRGDPDFTSLLESAGRLPR